MMIVEVTTILQVAAQAELPGAGVNVWPSLGEATARPFAALQARARPIDVRAGVKFGAGPSAQAEAAPSWDYTGDVGESLGEARAGPLAARAGVKFGAGIRNGVPEVVLGDLKVALKQPSQ